MNFNKAANVILIVLVAVASAMFLGCSDGEDPGNAAAATPTEAYKKLFAAVKTGKTEEIKKSMSKASISFAQGVSAQQGKGMDELLKNGFTRTTMSENLPPMRDERVKDTFGAVEVFSEKDGKWEDLPFIFENDEWKFAVGDLFNGTWKRPGISRSMREQMNTNTTSPTNVAPYGNRNINPNFNGEKLVPILPKRAPNTGTPSGNKK